MLEISNAGSSHYLFSLGYALRGGGYQKADKTLGNAPIVQTQFRAKQPGFKNDTNYRKQNSPQHGALKHDKYHGRDGQDGLASGNQGWKELRAYS
ncbi:MAG: hypothetical protein HW399_1087 [Dehalococcoidia bacterium]|nr:hypothetical protein [Dehalococcoidia bacterium]